MRFVTTTIGCKVNQYETEASAAALERLGGVRLARSAASRDGGAELVVINTCCVTATAAAKSRRAIGRAVRRHPSADLLIFGCYATPNPEALRRVARRAGSTGRIHVAGHRDDIAACVYDCAALSGSRPAGAKATSRPANRARPHASGATKPLRTSVEAQPGGRGWTTSSASPAGPVGNDGWMRAGPSQFPVGLNPSTACTSTTIKPRRRPHVKANVGTAGLGPIQSFAGHQRAFVKVQDGCDAFCTYCVVPHVRGRPWCRPGEQVLREVEALAANGHKEVVLCGVFLGAYGQPTTIRRRWAGPSALPGLLRRIAEVKRLWRVRLSSLHPADVTDELLEVFRHCPRVAPHLHLPLQSGSREVLRRMNRRYTPADYLAAVGGFRRAIETPAITTDVMVGFPGETDEDFADTLQLAGEVGFGKIHIFPFSPRPGTAAWKWRRQAPPAETVKARCRQLAALATRSAEAFRRQFVGRTVEALVEKPNSATPPGHARGLTDRYIEVTFPRTAGTKRLTGEVVRVSVTGLGENGLRGSLAGRITDD